jgi:hypothetical protein
MSQGQDIFYYVVNVIYQRKIGKKMYPLKGYELTCVSRAKNMRDLNKDNNTLYFLEKQMSTNAKKLNFRVSKILSQKKIGHSLFHKESTYTDEFK